MFNETQRQTDRPQKPVFRYETFDQTRDTDLARPYMALATLLECDPDEIAIGSSATEAWQQVLYGLSWSWQPGDMIYTSVSEYGSNYIAYMQLKKRRGVEIVTIPELPETGDFDLQAFETLLLNAAARCPETKTKFRANRVVLVSVNHVPTSSGKVYDVQGLGRLTSKYNIPYLVDACQSVGQMPVNVKAIGCDFLSGTGRKYLRAPRGSGFLYCKRSTLEWFEPATLDNMGARWDSQEKYIVHHTARRFERYEMSFAAKVGLGVAVEECLKIGIDAIWERIQYLATRLRSGLSTIPGVTVTDRGKVLCGIVTFILNRMSAEDAQKQLLKKRINTSVSQVPSTRLDFEKRGLKAVVRASVHVFNTEIEINRMLSAVRSLRPPCE